MGEWGAKARKPQERKGEDTRGGQRTMQGVEDTAVHAFHDNALTGPVIADAKDLNHVGMA